jgi:hypothetical protein
MWGNIYNIMLSKKKLSEKMQKLTKWRLKEIQTINESKSWFLEKNKQD